MGVDKNKDSLYRIDNKEDKTGSWILYGRNNFFQR